MSGVPVIFDRQTEQVLPPHVEDEGHFESTIPAAWYATEERLSRFLGEIALDPGLNVEDRARVYSFATAASQKLDRKTRTLSDRTTWEDVE